MANFVQTMKDWRRMCKTIGGDNCDGCKLHIAGNDCIAVYEGEMDYAQAEKAIAEWAAEHPAPVYPTWENWLTSLGVQTYNELSNPIPADIAVKLGIEPKK